jgi:hypothetical protein
MKKILFLSVGIAAMCLQTASAQLLESWENTLDGWTVSGDNTSGSSFSSSLGVTDGSYSLAISFSAAPGYGTPLYSSYQSSFTTALASSSALSLDVYTPGGSFGYYLQTQMWINNADTGYNQLAGGAYLSTTIGSETTLIFSLPPTLAAALAASSNPTQIGLQMGGGYSAGNETVYLDNLQAIPAPEPTTLALIGLGAAGLLAIRRRKE